MGLFGFSFLVFLFREMYCNMNWVEFVREKFVEIFCDMNVSLLLINFFFL